MNTSFNYETIRTELNKESWQATEPGREERMLFLGTVFALTPSGKFYTPMANSNVTEKEAEKDKEWYDAVSEELGKMDLYLMHGEWDPCDLFAGESRNK